MHGQTLAHWVWNPLEPQLFLPLNAPWHDQMITFTLTRQVQPQLQWCYTNGQLVKVHHKTVLAAGLQEKTATCDFLLQYSCSPSLHNVFPQNSKVSHIPYICKWLWCSYIYNKKQWYHSPKMLFLLEGMDDLLMAAEIMKWMPRKTDIATVSTKQT